MKWVYRLFHGIHVLKLNLNNQMQHIVLNLNDLISIINNDSNNINKIIIERIEENLKL